MRKRHTAPHFFMAALEAAIQPARVHAPKGFLNCWMAGSSPAMTKVR